MASNKTTSRGRSATRRKAGGGSRSRSKAKSSGAAAARSRSRRRSVKAPAARRGRSRSRSASSGKTSRSRSRSGSARRQHRSDAPLYTATITAIIHWPPPAAIPDSPTGGHFEGERRSHCQNVEDRIHYVFHQISILSFAVNQNRLRSGLYSPPRCGRSLRLFPSPGPHYRTSSTPTESRLDACGFVASRSFSLWPNFKRPYCSYFTKPLSNCQGPGPKRLKSRKYAQTLEQRRLTDCSSSGVLPFDPSPLSTLHPYLVDLAFSWDCLIYAKSYMVCRASSQRYTVT